MSIHLFKHNQEAYNSVTAMLEREKMAAVIHPTGTGKSLIAFKLAEEHPSEKFLWLSPSEYIYQTQLENLGMEFDNIQFMSYSRLMKNEDSIETLHPDYIILDEFHRCGAAEWGKSVRKLLTAYPDAKRLGLSATNIRYLDNQRNMAEEIFDGKIASEMTLGEAIVRGILPEPKYVIAMYSYKKELDQLKKRIQALSNQGLITENQKLLEQLRRALEQAEGLDIVFEKHMEKKNGKYIVFCSGKEHMDEMKEQVSTWFRRVDREPRIYTAFYNDTATDREFREFKKDNSAHLKLLFCIDMLNEGVHVDDVDGVILLRPTVSPIIYLQQIGRALSAGSRKTPVIFDLVNNFDSLYCIDSLKKELEERDRLCVGFMKLQQFTQESLRTNGIAAKQSAKASGVEPVDACGTEIRSVGVDTNPTALVETEKMGWLFQKFRNPERPAYIHEKGRISSEWLEQLHQIMELAGLPAGTFEAVSLSAQEVNGLINLMGEKLTARQYMTFLMLYSVSRELAQAGRTAAALQFIQTSRLRGASPAAMGTGMTAAALMSGGAGAMVAERSRYGVRKMSDADGNLVSAEQLALYTQSVPQASQNSY